MKKKIAWVEKYRPNIIDNIVQQNEIKSILENAFETNTLTHMLLYGPPGTGKTTTALTICKFFYNKKNNQFLNDKIIKERVLELNASDERGIKIVRDKIKQFAISSINNYDNVPKFKIIILDEADAMTSDSQFALRRIIEKYTEYTRFILICNYVTKIIPPLASRCMKLRFKNISLESLEKIIKRISLHEQIPINNDYINRLSEITKGDLRKAINMIERNYYIDSTFSIETLNNISGQIDENYMNEIWNTLISNKTNIKHILKLVNEFKNSSYSSLIVLDNLFKLILKSNISDSNKSKLILELSNIDYNLNDNANEFIQLIKLFTLINIIYKKNSL
jgi:replication factor C subunit 2/4